MRKHTLFFTVGAMFLLAALVLTACAPVTTPATREATEAPAATQAPAATEEEHAMKEGMEMGEGEEHAGEEHAEGMEHEHAEPPDEYANLTNPFADDPEAIAAGEQIYVVNCAPCHGKTGQGDGPAGAALDPKPANLADAEMMSMMSDGYLFWRVSEGGLFEPFSSAMPPWKDTLSEEQRWQVIAFERTLGLE